jgi:outer membrane lipoprotein-sorting protein
MIKRTGILLLVVMLAALFSGCVSEMSADQIVQKMKEKQEGVKDFSATMAFSMSFAGQNIAAKAKIMNKMPDKTRVEYIEPSEVAGQVVVSDGTTIWTYDPKTKIAMKEEMQKTDMDFQQDYMKPVSELLDNTDITYLGMDKFEGRTVYRVKAVPKNESALIGIHSSMWVDSETWMPLKIEIADKNDKPITSFEYSDVKFNTGIPDSEFEFKAPQGAKVVT